MRFFGIPLITKGRIALAMFVAIFVDIIQVLLGPLGFFVVDEVLDVIAMGLISWAIGFHPLLLPTFVIELLPGIDLVPTWTGCTVAVLAMRRKNVGTAPAANPVPTPGTPDVDRLKQVNVVEAPPPMSDRR